MTKVIDLSKPKVRIKSSGTTSDVTVEIDIDGQWKDITSHVCSIAWEMGKTGRTGRAEIVLMPTAVEIEGEITMAIRKTYDTETSGA